MRVCVHPEPALPASSFTASPEAAVAGERVPVPQAAPGPARARCRAAESCLRGALARGRGVRGQGAHSGSQGLVRATSCLDPGSWLPCPRWRVGSERPSGVPEAWCWSGQQLRGPHRSGSTAPHPGSPRQTRRGRWTPATQTGTWGGGAACERSTQGTGKPGLRQTDGAASPG